jgi:hypothetical protein
MFVHKLALFILLLVWAPLAIATPVNSTLVEHKGGGGHGEGGGESGGESSSSEGSSSSSSGYSGTHTTTGTTTNGATSLGSGTVVMAIGAAAAVGLGTELVWF